jgi:hypothetical protein
MLLTPKHHALDTKTPSILHAHGSIVDHNGDIGMVIHDQISPSFKEGLYEVMAAFMAEDLLANKCDCKVGADTDSCGSERHICIHCLPVLYKLIILLFNGLAKHSLVEFTSCFTKHDKSTLHPTQMATLKESI